MSAANVPDSQVLSHLLHVNGDRGAGVSAYTGPVEVTREAMPNAKDFSYEKAMVIALSAINNARRTAKVENGFGQGRLSPLMKNARRLFATLRQLERLLVQSGQLGNQTVVDHIDADPQVPRS